MTIMKKILSLLLVTFHLSLFSLQPEGFIVNNRILIKVNGKTISVLDVMKKMNVSLNEYFPQYANSPEARYEFFSTQWKHVLAQMIDHELILADAEKMEITVKDAEVRERLQERFGPNVVINLENLGITFEEAKKMVETEMLVQRVTWYRINSKAFLRINPKDIKGAYQEYCANNIPQDEWKYQSLSIRSADPKEAELLSEKAYSLLQQGKAGLAAVADDLKAEKLSPDTSITVSQELCVAEKDLSESHRTVLASLEEGTYSLPLEQQSRDNQSLKRIFQLKEHTRNTTPTFNALSEQLENTLIDNAIAEETASYIFKLRKRLGFDIEQIYEIPESFQPFIFTNNVQTK